MVTIGFIPAKEDAAKVVSWTVFLAEPDAEIEFVYSVLSEMEADELETAVKTAIADCGLTDPIVHRLVTASPVDELVEYCRRRRIRRIVTASFDDSTTRVASQNSSHLLRSSPCEIIVHVAGKNRPVDLSGVILDVTGGPDDFTGLGLVDLLRTRHGLEVTVAAVESNHSPEARKAGERSVGRMLHDAEMDDDRFTTQILVDGWKQRGLRSLLDDNSLLVVGRESVSDVVENADEQFHETTLVVKRQPSLSLRAIPNWIPRIHPADHADLLHDLRMGSRWSTDFIWMLGLAAAIASLGMLQNSPAVVIGSMLLAPLMTPIIGLGLAIAQANGRLGHRCITTILRGLTFTLIVSFFLGIATPSDETLSPEIISRGNPNVLDLLIALFAAIAATLAMARPHISGALAGVAIATALVPPLCAVGLALASAEFLISYGAAILFLTNLVAIIIASSWTFTFIGVTSATEINRSRTLSHFTRWGLLALVFILAGPLSVNLIERLDEGRDEPLVYPVTRQVARSLLDHLELYPGVDLSFAARSSITDAVVVHVVSNHVLDPMLADELEDVVRMEMNDDSVQVHVVAFDGIWLSRDRFHE